MRRVDPTADGAAAATARRPARWLLALAAAGVLIGWQLVRHGRPRIHARAVQHEVHRWEGEGGQVLD